MIAVCPYCRYPVATVGHGGNGYTPRGSILPADPCPVLLAHGPHATRCPGSGEAVPYPPRPGDSWTTWAMHSDACRTADGDACVCPLQTPPPARPDQRTALEPAQCRDLGAPDTHRASGAVLREGRIR